MSNKKKSKGRLQQYLGWPIWFVVAMAIVNVILFLVDRTAGFVMLPLTLAGVAAAGLLFWYQKTRISGAASGTDPAAGTLRLDG